MGEVVTRKTIHEGVQAWLAEATGFRCGLLGKPDGVTLDDTYHILYPITKGRGEGDMGDPERDNDWVYQVSTFGPSKDAVFWASSQVDIAFLGRTAAGKYQHPLVISGVSIQWRLSDSTGGIIPSGVSSFEAQDTYRIRIGA